MEVTPGPRRRVIVLDNPSAGTGTRAALIEAARAAGLDVDIDLVRADSAESLRERARTALAHGADALVVRGGDGMVHLGVGLVAGTSVPLGVLPSGTGNDFARAAGISRRRDDHGALAALIAGLEHPSAGRERIDALRLRNGGTVRWAANSVNIGFDAAVNERANRLRWIPGTLRYLVALVAVARAFRTVPFRIALDDEPLSAAPGPLVTVGNGSSVGGGIRLLPTADLADGQLDVLQVGPLSRAALALLFPLAAVGMHRSLGPVRLRRATRVRIEAPDHVLVYADGEPVGRGDVEVEVVPGAWTLLRGRARGH